MPSFIMMPLTSSVLIGIESSFVLYPICLIAQKRYKEVHSIMSVFCLLFLLYFAFIV